MFITNNNTSFHLWWKENLVKNQKVFKYYVHDCRTNTHWKVGNSLSCPGRTDSTYNHFIFIIFWEFLMLYQIFLSPKVKRCIIITYKNGIYELHHELPNELRLKELSKLGKNEKISGKCLNFIEWKPSAQPSCQNEHFANTSKNVLKNRS